MRESLDEPPRLRIARMELIPRNATAFIAASCQEAGFWSSQWSVGSLQLEGDRKQESGDKGSSFAVALRLAYASGSNRRPCCARSDTAKASSGSRLEACRSSCGS